MATGRAFRYDAELFASGTPVLEIAEEDQLSATFQFLPDGTIATLIDKPGDEWGEDLRDLMVRDFLGRFWSAWTWVSVRLRFNSAHCLCLFCLHARNDRASEIDAAARDCSCEQSQVSPWSTTPVAPDEVLVRLVLVDDVRIDGNGGVTLKDRFFSHAAENGASCLRLGRACPSEFRRTAKKITRSATTASTKRVYGFVRIPVTTVKSITHDLKDLIKDGKVSSAEPNPRAFCVYATGEFDRPNHADIFVNRASDIPNNRALRAGKNLTKSLQGTVRPIGELQEADLSRWAG